jgi:hypothetical protein
MLRVLRDFATTVAIVIVICIGATLVPVITAVITVIGVLLCICALAAIIYSVLHDTVD